MRAVTRQATVAVTAGARAGGCYPALSLRTRQPQGAPVSDGGIDRSRLRSVTAREIVGALLRDGFSLRNQAGAH